MTHAARRPSPLRWVFLLLSFVITMVGYADRQFLALLKPALDAQFHWSPVAYGWMGTGFQLAIAISLLGAGWFLDRAGLRWGFAAGLFGWSLASGLHAFARSVPQFIAARVALGMCESVGTPAGMKALAMFFAPAERNLAIGITNTAPNIAAILTPLAVTALYALAGWQATVLCLAALGFVCLALWLSLPFARLAAAQPGVAAPATFLGGWRPYRDPQAWMLAGAKALTDQAWWFMLYWLPDFMHQRFALDMRALGAPVASIYALAACGALAGGVLPGLIRRATGRQAAAARRLAMAGFALCVTPIALIGLVQGEWPSVAVIGLALACHQGFATNIFAIAAEAFPAARIGTAIGFAAFFGNLGGAASVLLAGLLLRHGLTLAPMFALAAGGYGAAWCLLQACGGFRASPITAPG